MNIRLRIFLCFLLATLPAALLQAATEEGGASLFDLLRQGGWAMYPLGALSLAMFYLLFHCFQQTQTKRFFDPADLSSAREALAKRDVAGAQSVFEKGSTALSRLMRISLGKARVDETDARRAAMEQAYAEAAEGEENDVGQWINYLNVVATVAPMVGLLGTVSGMIGAFQKIGQAGMGRPEELAGNIGEALITTATGLVIGIPAMIAYFIYRNRLNARMLKTHQAAGELFDALCDSPPAKK
ncbi:MAG: MotA/TolQ/ExbB proton channel family protein [Opitutales bacterium]|nr:MotA/TolQ/ExbB proton channel family protein [Opitutales bacterium]